jgi:hypothetical protein
MNNTKYSKIELASLVVSALISIGAILMALAFSVIPINPTTLYVGKLTAIGGLILIITVLLLTIQTPLIATILIKIRLYRFQTLIAFILSISCWFVSLLYISFLPSTGVATPESPPYVLWIGLVLTLVAAFLLWRSTMKSGGNGMPYTNSTPMIIR